MAEYKNPPFPSHDDAMGSLYNVIQEFKRLPHKAKQVPDKMYKLSKLNEYLKQYQVQLAQENELTYEQMSVAYGNITLAWEEFSNAAQIDEAVADELFVHFLKLNNWGMSAHQPSMIDFSQKIIFICKEVNRKLEAHKPPPVLN